MEALLSIAGLVVWVVVWVLIVKKRGTLGRFWANVLGAVVGLLWGWWRVRC